MTPEQLFELLDKDYGKIENLTINENLLLDFSKSKSDLSHCTSISFENCTFNGSFQIQNLKFDHRNISFQNCNFNKKARQIWQNIECSLFSLDDCTFHNLAITKSIIEIGYIVNCTIVNILHLFSIKGENFNIINENKSHTVSSILINSDEIDLFDIQSINQIKEIRLEKIKNVQIASPVKDLIIHAKQFENIEIEKNDEDQRTYSVQNLKLNSTNFEGQIQLYEISIEKLQFQNINSSKGNVRFNEVKIKNAHFIDCSIASFYWNQVTFEEDPEIIRCDLSGLKMTNVNWTADKKLSGSYLDEPIPWFYGIFQKQFEKIDEDYKEEDIIEMQYQRDTYRQLKAASIANHNHIEALDFYRNEMRLYWKEIRIKGGVKWYDRILIFLNRIVSDFGQNWFMPLIWLISFHFIFMMCLFNWQFSWNYSNFENGLGQYFFLLNPIHKTPEYINTGWGFVTEFFMRIFGAYFIYHFLKASRKFGKL